uniref:Ovule protein n=1 Tax=Heterorhabditis bacteriophora TaxID=37862 RepID=A0A1I7XN81_HETBA
MITLIGDTAEAEAGTEVGNVDTIAAESTAIIISVLILIHEVAVEKESSREYTSTLFLALFLLRRDEALQSATSMTREVENMQANVDLRLVEYRRMENELGTAREKERMWKAEKMEIEKRLSSKDSLLAHERKQAELQKKRDREQIDRLEDKLKSERPGWEGQLGIVDPLIDESRRSAVIPIAISHVAHAPRVQSAPPAPISNSSFDPCPSHYPVTLPPNMNKMLQENQPELKMETNSNSMILDIPVACPSSKDGVAPFTEIVLNSISTTLSSTVKLEVKSDVVEPQGSCLLMEKNEIPEQESINLDDESILEGVPLDVSHPIDEAALLDSL